ncbi:peptidoglycan-binding protein [Thermocatellispora tengchongensis]|uniref:peptidoglycan-binding protein n=1 Tax=Thermocatellispora tengchongensis TaxID=1073253 RepID=UPI00363FDAB2
MTGSRRGGRPLVWAAAVLAGCGGVAAAVLVTGAGPEPEAPRPAPPGPARATVERTTLTERKTVRGTLGYAGRAEVTAAAPGRLTWRPRAGRVVRQGQRLYQVDGRDVLLLYGEQPAYRRLKAGDEGRDVRQFEKALAALGYTGFTVDDDYTAATAAAVRRWQEDRGLKETGEVDPATVWYAPGPVRVDARKAALGQTLAPGAPVLTLTSPRRVVTVPISIGDHRLVRVGGAVTVTLPGGKTVRGTVASIGSEVKKREGTGACPRTPSTSPWTSRPPAPRCGSTARRWRSRWSAPAGGTCWWCRCRRSSRCPAAATGSPCSVPAARRATSR